MKTGQRIQQLAALVSGQYSHIWDCCCDHGLLGQLLLQQQVDNETACRVHFMDVVPALMAKLEQQLETYHQGADWQVHCGDVARLADKLQPEELPQLIIIAGVGGDLLAELVRSICQQASVKIEFLLCPVHHTYKVRQALNALGLKLHSETLIWENRRFYEALHVSLQGTAEITNAGESMWDFSQPEHRLYLQQTVEHYRRIARNPQRDVTAELQAYESLCKLAG